MSHPEDVPLVLVHGWAGSFRETWQSTGVDALLSEAGRDVRGIDLLGHGEEEKPHDPAAYEDLHRWLLARLASESEVVDAVGFSLGALTLLRALIDSPHRFGRVVLAGIGDRVFAEPDAEEHQRVIDALEGRGDSLDNRARTLANHAEGTGKDKAALTAVLKRTAPVPLEPGNLSGIANEVLVVIGENDFAAPATRLAEALPNSRLLVLPRTDHFATPESFAFIDALLGFLGTK